MSFLDVTSDDVAKLDDKQFRELIARLCEAEVEQKGLPRTAVTWGGHQDASDGGVDIRVGIDDCPTWRGDIPKSLTIFQSKDSEMNEAKIRREMCPGGVLRPVILDVLTRGGAYVIASNRDVADKALQKRKQAMEDAVRADLLEHRGVLEFYDRSRLATWTRSHPGVLLWLRSTIGRPLQGWMSWGELKERHGGDFLNDKALRLRMPRNADCQEMGIVEGIERLRAALSSDGACVRLAGLSGVGKTRLVQALFEESVGVNALASHELLYTDMSDDPMPSPLEICRQIHAQGRSSIVVVDNCPPDQHSRITIFVKETKSRIRLLTVEYDVRVDEPDETDVFRLDPASDDLIERLLRIRFRGLQQADARKIAEFSGGNARVAIVLAKTVGKGESLTGLKDADLFRRLFQQRHGESEQLQLVASCCSLVYSFRLDDEPEGGISAELQILSELASMDPATFHRHVMELQRRELLQRRSVWAAVLPHAIANRLAKHALESIPKHRILGAFTGEGRQRLMKSFARRLGYLSDSEQAKVIACEWMAPGGLLGDLPNLDDEQFSWFERVAPIAETEALDAIERALRAMGMKDFLDSYSPFHQNAERLIRLLAFQPENFSKAVDLLRWMQSHLDDSTGFSAFLDRYKALFTLHNSGTMVLPSERLRYLRTLFTEAVAESDRKIALVFVECGLEAIYPAHHQSYEFGCRVGVFGHAVKSWGAIQQWYRDLLNFVVDQILSHSWSETNLRSLLGKKFQGLWEYVGLKLELESVVDRLVASGGWIEGYNAVRKTLIHAQMFGGERYTFEDFERLRLLEKRLSSMDLVSRTRLICSPDYRDPWEELDRRDEDGANSLAEYNRWTGEELREVGRLLWTDKVALEQSLSEMLSGQFPKAKGVMRGVLEEVESVRDFWEWFEKFLGSQSLSDPNPDLVAGVVEGILARDKPFGTEVMDDMVEHPQLARIFPFVQFLLPFDSVAHQRIIHSVKQAEVPVSLFQCLGYGRVHEQLDDGQLIDVLKAICARDKGAEVVLTIMGKRFQGLENGEYRPSLTMEEYAQEWLLKYSPLKKRGDYQISLISAVAFSASGSNAKAADFGCRLALSQKDGFGWLEIPQTYAVLQRMHPRSLLDGCLLNLDWESSSKPGYRDLPSQSSRVLDEDPFADLSDDLLEAWCAEDPGERELRLARFVRLYSYDPERQRVVWRSFVPRMIARSSDPIRFLDQVVEGFRPNQWNASLAEILENYQSLLADLELLDQASVVEWIKGQSQQLRDEIDHWKKWDERQNSGALQGFE